MDPSSLKPIAAGNGTLPVPAITGGATILTPTSMPIPNISTAPADPLDVHKLNLSQTINSIEKTLGLLHQLNLTVSSFNVAAQLPLLKRLNSLVAELHTMQKLAENCNIQVPIEVVNLIDDGKNPDEFTKDIFHTCIAKNQITKGKTDAFKSLRKYLLEDLEQAFPDEVESYRDIRASSAAEIKRLSQLQNMMANGDVKVKTEH